MSLIRRVSARLVALLLPSGLREGPPARDVVGGEIARGVRDIIDHHLDPEITPEWRERISARLDKGLREEPDADLDGLLDGLLGPAIDAARQEGASRLLESWRRAASPAARQNHRDRRDFEARLEARWREGFDRFTLLVLAALNSPETLPELTAKETISLASEPLVSALVLLHSRACSVAAEIETLIRAGYADGANARARTLHEIAVIAFFLAEGGDELARRYLDHDVVESWRAAKLHEKYRDRLGHEPLDPRLLSEVEKDYNEVLDQYGGAFATSHGWAAEALASASPRFADIEKALRMDHHRPRYKLASHPTHANPKGVLFRLASIGDEIRAMPGASNAGLADPAIGASISLYQATAALLLNGPGAPTIRSIQFLGAMNTLIDEIDYEFERIDSELRTEARVEDGPYVTPAASLEEIATRRFRRRRWTR